MEICRAYGLLTEIDSGVAQLPNAQHNASRFLLKHAPIRSVTLGNPSFQRDVEVRFWPIVVSGEGQQSTHCCRWRQTAIERLHSSRYLEASRKR